jgi:hypothetical protein
VVTRLAIRGAGFAHGRHEARPTRPPTRLWTGLSKARARYTLLVCFLSATFPDQRSPTNVGNLGLHIDSEIFSDLIQSAM